MEKLPLSFILVCSLMFFIFLGALVYSQINLYNEQIEINPIEISGVIDSFHDGTKGSYYLKLRNNIQIVSDFYSKKDNLFLDKDDSIIKPKDQKYLALYKYNIQKKKYEFSEKLIYSFININISRYWNWKYEVLNGKIKVH